MVRAYRSDVLATSLSPETGFLHVAMTLRLKSKTANARPVPYYHQRTAQAGLASRTMLSTGIVIFGPDRRVKFFNGAFRDLFNLDAPFLRQEPTADQFLDKLRERRQIPEQADFRSFKQEWTRHVMSVIEPFEELQLFRPVPRAVLVDALEPRPDHRLYSRFVPRHDRGPHLPLELLALAHLSGAGGANPQQ